MRLVWICWMRKVEGRLAAPAPGVLPDFKAANLQTVILDAYVNIPPTGHSALQHARIIADELKYPAKPALREREGKGGTGKS